MQVNKLNNCSVDETRELRQYTFDLIYAGSISVDELYVSDCASVHYIIIDVIVYSMTDSTHSSLNDLLLIFAVRGGLRMFKLDRECAMVGGICMSVDDCDPEYLSTTKGLCPSNAHHGVECCYRCE